MTSQYEHTIKALCLAEQCCALPPDSASLRKFFKQAIAAHWEDPNNHGRYKTELACFSPVKEDGSGNLDVMMSYQDKSGNNVPVSRIVVEIPDTKFVKLSMDNEVEVSSDFSTKTSGWQVNSHMVIKHVFTDADVALMAAQSTMEFIAGFRKQMCDSLGLNLLDPVSLSEPKVRSESKHPQPYFQVDVVLLMNYNFCISVNIESHRLKVVSHEYTITS